MKPRAFRWQLRRACPRPGRLHTSLPFAHSHSDRHLHVLSKPLAYLNPDTDPDAHVHSDRNPYPRVGQRRSV